MVLNVVCCLWGSWPEVGWGEEYVARLKRGVERNLTVPHRFICYADFPKRVEHICEARKLNAPSWRGCLPKLYVYSPEADLEGRVLLLDLDNVITGSLDEMAAYDGDLAVRAWFAGYDRGERVADGDMIGFEAGSGVTQDLWNNLVRDPVDAERRTKGRERFFIREIVTPDLWQDVLGARAVVSYKRHIKREGLLPETSIVSFHDNSATGNTQRPHQVIEMGKTRPIEWLKEHWR